MNLTNERKLALHVKALGESATADVLLELAEHTQSASPLVRRITASAIGKLSGIVDSIVSVDLLRPLLADKHPQVRQYAAKALGAFGAKASCTLEDLRDLYKNPEEKDYVKRSVVASGKIIRQAVKIVEQNAFHKCSRCAVVINSDEYARSQKAFQRIYCDKCFDEVYLKRRNFDTQVEINKTICTNDGTFVQSDGERRISDWLSINNISYRYDERIRIIDGMAIRPDFYLPELDLYIEYWGMDTADYKIGMLKKQKLYQQEGKKLISLYFKDKQQIEQKISAKLSKFVISR